MDLYKSIKIGLCRKLPPLDVCLGARGSGDLLRKILTFELISEPPTSKVHLGTFKRL